MALDTLFGAGLLGAFFAAGALMIVLGLAIYIYFALALMRIGDKRKVKHSWLAFIPVLNVLVMLWSADLAWWWLLVAIVASFIPVLGQLAILAGFIYMWWRIAEKLKFPGWYGILMIIPIVNLVMIGVMAWKK